MESLMSGTLSAKATGTYSLDSGSQKSEMKVWTWPCCLESSREKYFLASFSVMAQGVYCLPDAPGDFGATFSPFHVTFLAFDIFSFGMTLDLCSTSAIQDTLVYQCGVGVGCWQ